MTFTLIISMTMIYKFTPILKQTIWGGDRIASFKRIDTDMHRIGESWEISGVPGDVSVVAEGPEKGSSLTQLIERHGARLLGEANFKRFGNEFPLLIKYIDAAQDLSIQVHPDDEAAARRHGCKGKTEMWYVVDSTGDAHLKVGFRNPLSPDEYENAVESGLLDRKLMDHNVKARDVFHIPAGRVHSIGAGCLIAEIQQTSNITYRIFDYNRVDSNGNRRELHTELARDVIDYTAVADYRTNYLEASNQPVTLSHCRHFSTRMLTLDRTVEADLSLFDSFVILMLVQGSAQVECDNECIGCQQGDTLLIPATATQLTITPSTPQATLLSAKII